MSDKCQCLFWLSFISTLYICFRNIKQKQMEWLTNQFQGNASVEDSLVYGISRAARKACAGSHLFFFRLQYLHRQPSKVSNWEKWK